MSKENKALVLRWMEQYGKGNLDAADEYFATDFVGHQSPNPDFGLESLKKVDSANWAAFPDMRMTVEDVITEGDKVVVRTATSGTHTGEWAGTPPTGKKGTTTGILIYRVANGKIVEGWINVDFLGILRQLGFKFVPPHEQTDG